MSWTHREKFSIRCEGKRACTIALAEVKRLPLLVHIPEDDKSVFAAGGKQIRLGRPGNRENLSCVLANNFNQFSLRNVPEWNFLTPSSYSQGLAIRRECECCNWFLFKMDHYLAGSVPRRRVKEMNMDALWNGEGFSIRWISERINRSKLDRANFSAGFCVPDL